MTAHTYQPDVVYPAGETLAELLEERAMTQADLATRTGLSPKHINQIIKGVAPITPDTALALQRATGVDAEVWNRLDSAHQAWKASQAEAKRFAADTSWLEDLPIDELRKRRYLPAKGDAVETMRAVCQFFGVVDRTAWNVIWEKPTAFRTSQAFRSNAGAVAAWLRIGEIRAASMPCAPFDKAKLVAAVPKLRALSRQPDPSIWGPALSELCASAGVAVVIEPEIKGARINGAARWLSPEKALVQLSMRHKSDDVFWFTLFHEIGHLLLHSKKEVFINDPNDHSAAEDEADAYAKQVLIPRSFEAALGDLRSIESVVQFADEIGVSPGVVVGRLHHEKLWPYRNGAKLKQRYEFR